MRLLLDTHSFLWSYSEPNSLPKRSRDAISHADNEIFVSSVSIWEIAIKLRLGKLRPIGQHPGEIVSIASSMGMICIPLSPDEAATSSELVENTHFDPFDRMLIWQAIQRDMFLVSGDAEFARFKADGLKLFWK